MKNKNKILSISFVVIALTVLLLSQAIMLEAKPKPRAGGGTFNDGDFFTPDYGNGGSETFDVGENRTFNYNCHCSNQPPAKSCSGNIILRVDTGSGFTNEKSDTCSINAGQTCSANHVKTFSTADTYTFRVFCDESTGTDYTQSSNEHVVLTVQESGGCTENETQLCPLQQGVCEGAEQTCINGSWTECDYGNDYEDPEATCDELDNDCNGYVDDVDSDGDGYSACVGGPSFDNELLIVGLNNDVGNITILEYNSGTSQYDSVWSDVDASVSGTGGGGEIGDVNHDGVNDFVITGYNATAYYIEVWSYNSSNGEWYFLWRGAPNSLYFGDIADFDNDGKNEILVSGGLSWVRIYGNDTVGATSFGLEATLFTDDNCDFHSAGGDMDGDGVPEIVTQCFNEDVRIWEWSGSAYVNIANVTKPVAHPGVSGGNVVIDDMECGDLDHDSADECVLCGNTGRSSIIDYVGGTYKIVYNSSYGVGSIVLTESCSIGDVTNDGWLDWFDTHDSGSAGHDYVRVFSYNASSGSYYSVWNSTGVTENFGIGCTCAGDSDNDGRGEFFTYFGTPDKQKLFESDSVGATSFSNTFNWSTSKAGGVIIGDFDSDAGGTDCNDSNASIHPGALEICGDGIDQDCDGNDTACNCVDNDNDTYNAYNAVTCPTGDDCNDNNASINLGANETCDNGVDDDCDDEIDEGCGEETCGNDYCAGSGLGEDCFTCPADCLCLGPNCKNACCGNGVCDSPQENAGNCPVDCS